MSQEQEPKQLQSVRFAAEVKEHLDAVTKIRADVFVTPDGYSIEARALEVKMKLPLFLTPKQVARVVSHALDSVDGFTKASAAE